MLASVLLHVIEATWPVDDAAHRVSHLRDRTIDDMHHVSALIVGDIDDTRKTEHTGIKRLTACGRIERRAIETDGMESGAVFGSRMRLNAHNGGVELAFVGVIVVQAFGHELEMSEKS